MNTWNDYFKKTKGKPRPLLVEALPYSNKEGKALDLGCGAGNDSRYLQEMGYSVVSIDSSKEVKEHVPNAIISTLEDYVFPKNEFAIVNAQFVLPFCAQNKIRNIVESIKESLVPGGIFTGQFFGHKDSWSKNPKMSFQTENDVRNFFKDFEILKLKEQKEQKKTALGEPHFWHVFHVIARKKV